MLKIFTRLLLVITILTFTYTTQAQIQKKVLFEKFTSAKCGNCPDGTAIIENMTDSVADIIWVSHHAGWITDVMGFPTIDTIAIAFTSGAPKAAIDRFKFSNESEVAASRPNWASQVQQQLAKPASVDVNLNGWFDASTREAYLQVTANFAMAPTPGDFRINVYVVEDSVTGGSAYSQTNYFNNTPNHPFNSLGNPVVGYHHRNVVRDVISGAWGTANVIPNAPVLATNYIQDYFYTLPTAYNEDKVRFVAFVSYYDANVNNREVLNARELNFIDILTVNTKPTERLGFETTVFPNPAHDFLTINIKAQKTAEIGLSLFDINGKMIRNLGNKTLNGEETFSIDVNDLPQGVYILNISSPNGQENKKIVIQ